VFYRFNRSRALQRMVKLRVRVSLSLILMVVMTRDMTSLL